jgi:hypothetical protein
MTLWGKERRKERKEKKKLVPLIAVRMTDALLATMRPAATLMVKELLPSYM